jgi:hypothetical protein
MVCGTPRYYGVVVENMAGQMSVTKAVSLIAIPIGFASLSTFWLTRRYTPTIEVRKQSALEKYLEFENNLTTNQPHGMSYLWKTLEGAVIIIRAANELLSELFSRDIFDQFYHLLTALQQKKFTSSSQLNLAKILVLEGLPHNGVTTLTNELINSSTVKRCPAFDASVTAVMNMSKDFPISLKNALSLFCDYYKYSLAEELSLRDSCFVIIDRLYHTTCVQQLLPLLIETNQSNKIKENIEEFPSYAYQWPLDLPYPILVCLRFLLHPDLYRSSTSSFLLKTNFFVFLIKQR